jgi:C4-dicarboxylate-specific signal transduction histidine kinase
VESLGTLASGIAHDFSNLLGGVLAQADLALAELADGSSPEQEVKRIREVAIRSSEIVRQLMIYAGKETAQCRDRHSLNGFPNLPADRILTRHPKPGSKS